MGTASALVLWSLAAGPTEAVTPLQKAEGLIDDLEYVAAQHELDAALERSGNSRDELVRILWLKGMISASLNRPDAARLPLRTVALLAPDFRPDDNQPSRVMSAWFEAKGWADTNGALALEREGPLTVVVTHDGLGLARAVRFHLREDGGAWRTVTATLPAAHAADAVALRVEWWAELLGEREAVLVTLGSEGAALTDPGTTAPQVAEPVASISTPPPASVSRVAPSAPVAARARVPLSEPLQLAGYAGVGLGLVAAAVGSYFGAVSRAELVLYEGAARSPDGAVMGLTQRGAQALTAQQRLHASLSNGLFIAAGALAIAGIVAWLVGLSSWVAPATSGAVPGGSMP